jgi:hypothetical protein
MTPRFLGIEHEYEEGNSLLENHPSAHVEVANGHLVDVPGHAEVLLNMNLTYTDGGHFTVKKLVISLASHIYSYLSVNFPIMTTQLI